MKLDLQRFAEPETGSTTPPETEKTFTQADLDKLAGDIRAKERVKYEKELQTKIATAQTEAERLATLSAEEKAEAKRKKDEDAMVAREQGITKRELKAQAFELLAEKGLPKELADLLSYVDADSTLANIEAVEKVFRAAVKKGVLDQMKGTPPAAGSTTPAKSDREKLIDQYNEAEKAGDAAKMNALHAQIKAIKKE